MSQRAEKTKAFEDAAWAVALRLKTFGYAEIAVELQITHDRATTIVRGWEAAGRIRFQQGGTGNHRKMYALAPEASVRPDLTGSVPENLWNAMRGLKSFSPTDLRAHSTTETVQVTWAAANAMCQMLLRIGYLKVERTAIPGRREAIYRLIKATGPKPPREKRMKIVYDDNLGRVVHCGEMKGCCK